MEEVLEVYTRSYDERHPLICMDEGGNQPVEEVRTPLPVKPGEPERYDSEYERNGVSHLFMFFEPLNGRRFVKVTERRTAVDGAHQIRELTEVPYPHAKRITLGVHWTNWIFITRPNMGVG